MLLGAVAQEALERRADAAFGLVRTENERDQLFKTRLSGIQKRRTLTDAIQAYCQIHPDLSENYRKFVYSNCSDQLNLVVLGARAQQVRSQLHLSPSASIRDNLPEKALAELASVEEFACRIIENEDLEPLKAIAKAVALHHTKRVEIV